jgi:hypothetical protein
MNKIDKKKEVDYKTYLEIQRKRTLKKWGWDELAKEVFKAGFKITWDGVKDIIGKPKEIGCMGIRNGAEYFEFQEYLPYAVVYGIDILDKVKDVGGNCFCYDFNRLPKDWKNKFDLLFSNSLDHSYEVYETLKEWSRVTKKDGYLLLQLTPNSMPSSPDRYGFDMEDTEELFKNFEIIKKDYIEKKKGTFYVLLKNGNKA